MSSLPTFTIGICGFGTVGRGVWKHIERSRETLETRLGAKLALARAAAVRDLKKKRPVKIAASKLTDDPLTIANDPKIDIVVRTDGRQRVWPRSDFGRAKAGNRGLGQQSAHLRPRRRDLRDGAQAWRTFLFEASVAGGIRSSSRSARVSVANRFTRIYGILNGTCNYILTQMEENDAPYATVLAEAKRLGYAEADESLDVDGWDTAHKASVLAGSPTACGSRPTCMIVEGISRITPC